MTVNEVVENFTGVADPEMIAIVRKNWGRSLPADYLSKTRLLIQDAYRRELQPIPGVANIVKDLPMPCCVASSSSSPKLQLGLELTGLYGLFKPHVFSADMVRNGKPAPDLFLYAATQMNVATDTCLVIEDSIVGVRAALAAGMIVFGFSGGSHCGPQHEASLLAAGATEVLKDISKLPSLAAKAYVR